MNVYLRFSKALQHECVLPGFNTCCVLRYKVIIVSFGQTCLNALRMPKVHAVQYFPQKDLTDEPFEPDHPQNPKP